MTGLDTFRRWFGDSKATENGAPVVVYHGTRSAIDAFDLSRSRSEDGLFFTSCPVEAEGFATGEGMYYEAGENIVPVYLSIQNPHVVDVDGELYDPEMMRDLVEEARAEGADGLIVRNIQNFEFSEDWSDTYIVFEAAQVKSAIGNCGAFDPANPSIAR